MNPADLHLQKVTVIVGAVPLLQEVSLHVPAGACQALIGANGAGKTTLLDTVHGVRRASSGRILLDGRDITRASTTRIARLGVGRTFQYPAVCRRLSVIDNVLLATPRRMSLGTASHLLDQAQLAGCARIHAGDLSYGQQRRLELCIAMAGHPKLLLLDEPTAGLTSDDVDRLRQHLLALRGRVTVLMVDHDFDFITDVATTATTLAAGSLHRIPTSEVSTPAHAIDDVTVSARRHAASSMSKVPALSISGLSVIRAGRRVIDRLNLEVAAGEIVAVTGANGSGKSTLLETIAGLSAPLPGGRIEVRGVAASQQPSARARAGVVLLPQTRRIFHRISVTENLQVPAAASVGVPWSVERILDRLPVLRVRGRQKAGTLSGGEQQMLALARTLRVGPAVLLLDEPFEGLTSAAAMRMAALVRDIAAEGAAVLIAEHNGQAIDLLTDRHIDLTPANEQSVAGAQNLTELM